MRMGTPVGQGAQRPRGSPSEGTTEVVWVGKRPAGKIQCSHAPQLHSSHPEGSYRACTTTRCQSQGAVPSCEKMAPMWKWIFSVLTAWTGRRRASMAPRAPGFQSQPRSPYRAWVAGGRAVPHGGQQSGPRAPAAVCRPGHGRGGSRGGRTNSGRDPGSKSRGRGARPGPCPVRRCIRQPCKRRRPFQGSRVHPGWPKETTRSPGPGGSPRKMAAHTQEGQAADQLSGPLPPPRQPSGRPGARRQRPQRPCCPTGRTVPELPVPPPV